MDSSQTFQQLVGLRRQEKLAKEYLEATGREPGFGQFLYIEHDPHFHGPAEAMDRPEALAEQERLLKRFREVIPGQKLTAAYALPESQGIEMEQLLRFFHFSPHCHDFLEFVCVLSGKCTHTIDDYKFIHPAGDFAIVPPGVWHEHFASPDCVCLTAKVRKERFLTMFRSLISESSMLSAYFTQVLTMPAFSRALTFSGGNDPFIRELLLTMYDQQLRALPYSTDIIVRLWEVLFTYYLQNYQDTARFLEPNYVRDITSSEILNYIFANYQTITLKETANHFHFTPAYFSTKIHEMTGKTFSQLLLEYRLCRAADLLVQTNRKLGDICEDVGYHDASQFARVFKRRYGVPPTQYRKHNREPQMLT